MNHTLTTKTTLFAAALTLGLGMGTPCSAMDFSNDLHEAICDGDTQKALELIAAGHEVNGENQIGVHPLDYAASYGQLEVVQALINAGADVNAQSRFGRTPLHHAASSASWSSTAIPAIASIMQTLLAAGADINTQNIHGDTPLHSAAHFNRSHAVLALLQAGANTILKNSDGKIPLQLAPQGSPTAQVLVRAYQGIELMNTLAGFNTGKIIYMADVCAICQEGEGDTDREGVLLLPCGHAFHSNCLEGWLVRQLQRTCPTCRAALDPVVGISID